MPKPRSARLESPTARLRLAIAKKPYWTRLGPGIALGYRRNATAGTWNVRINGRDGWTKRLALADDLEPAAPPAVLSYGQALEEARKLARQEPDAPIDEGRPVTIGEALDRYEADLKSRGARTYNAEKPRRYLTGALLSKPVALLTATELKRWRDSLVDRMRPGNINRMVKGLRAALAIAGEHDPRIQNQAAIKAGLKPLPGTGRARNVILSDEQVRALLAAVYARDADLGLLVDVLAVTGTRPVQAARLVCGDLLADPRAPRLMMPRSGKGGGRNRIERKSQQVPVPITPALMRRLQAAAVGRPDSAPLLRQGNGSDWGLDPSPVYRRPMREIVAGLGLDPDQVTMYSLRHSAIVRQLLANTPIRVVAAACDTSVAMIESNYSRHISAHSDEIFRRGLLADEPAADNVISLQRNSK